MATPFVQGRLRGQQLSVRIETACAHCGQALAMTVDSDKGYEVHSAGANPLVFHPQINWMTFTDPNIIDAY